MFNATPTTRLPVPLYIGRFIYWMISYTPDHMIKLVTTKRLILSWCKRLMTMSFIATHVYQNAIYSSCKLVMAIDSVGHLAIKVYM